jgi:ribonuclease PH
VPWRCRGGAVEVPWTGRKGDGEKRMGGRGEGGQKISSPLAHHMASSSTMVVPPRADRTDTALRPICEFALRAPPLSARLLEKNQNSDFPFPPFPLSLCSHAPRRQRPGERVGLCGDGDHQGPRVCVRTPPATTGDRRAPLSLSPHPLSPPQSPLHSYGPRENTRVSGDATASGSLDCLVQYAPFATRRTANGAGPSPNPPPSSSFSGPSDDEREASRQTALALRPAVLLDRFPKALVDVHIVVLEAGGGELCAGLLASSLALAHAGVDLADVCAAASVCALAAQQQQPQQQPKRRLVVDPTSAELRAASHSTLVCMLPRRGVLTLTAHEGEAAADDLLASLRLGMDACATVAEQMRKVLGDEGRRRAARWVLRQQQQQLAAAAAVNVEAGEEEDADL